MVVMLHNGSDCGTQRRMTVTNWHESAGLVDGIDAVREIGGTAEVIDDRHR